MGLSLLIVDDDTDISNFVACRIRKESPQYSIAAVEGGRHCLEYLKSHQVDCILSDYQMPGMDGMELLLALRGEGNDVPFIFVTGQGNEEVAREAFKNGADDYFTKDIGFAHFTRILNSVEQSVKKRMAERLKSHTEAALRLSEERMFKAQRMAHVGNWELDLVNNKLYWSEEVYRIYGRDPEHFTPTFESVKETMHPDDLETFAAALKAATLEKIPLDMDYRLIRPDGTIRTVHTLGEVIYDQEGRPVKESGTVQDITERKEVEESLLLFMNLLDKSEEAIFVNDSVTGKFLFVNDKACASLGYDRQELLGLRTIDIESTLPDQFSWDAHVNEMRRVGSRILEGVQKRKDGSTFPVEVNVTNAASGNRDYMVAVVRDISGRKLHDNALVANEKHLRTIIDTAPVCIKIVSVEGNILTMNQAGLTMIEADSLDQVKGMSVFSLVAPEYHEAFKTLGENVWRGGAGSLEFEMVSLKDRRFWLETRAVPLRNERDEIIALLAITFDIKERKETEKALKESEERFRTLFESAEDGIFMVDGPVFVDCNTRGLEMYGFDDKDAIIGHTFLEFAPMLQATGESSEEMARRVIPVVLNGTPQKFNWTSIRRDGEHYDSEVSLNSVHIKGRTYVQAIVRDITGRKTMEEALKFQNVLLTAQQEATLDGILMVDPDGKIISYNKRFIEIWNIPVPQEVEDTRSDELALNSVLQYLKKPEEFLERVNYLYKHRTEKCRDEIQLVDERTLDRYTSPMYGSDGKYYGRVWYFRDITEMKNLERQRADFYAMVTHDLKSPLTAILGYATLIAETARKRECGDIEEMAKAVSRGGVKLMRLADDFLAAGMEPGCIRINPVPVDVAGLLTEVSDDFELLAKQKGISLKVDIPDSLPEVFLDKKHVERAVGNLLQNAFNYTPDGGEITLRAEAPSDGQVRHILVSVSDTGPGIAHEEQRKIFNKYYRSSNTEGVKGTGLGLAIVKAVAGAHGGRVEVESEPGRGSTFRLYLPAPSAGA